MIHKTVIYLAQCKMAACCTITLAVLPVTSGFLERINKRFGY